MAIATVGALALSDYSEGVAVMLLYQIGEWFQTYAVQRSRRSISSLMDIRPDTTRVLRGGVEEKDELIFSATYKNKKIEAESEVDGTFIKMTYVFEDNNFNKGTINLYIDKKLFATVKVRDSLQDGEMKMFYPNGKVMGTSVFKNGKLNGVSKMFYENGKIMMKMNFKDDELEGEAIIYDEDGKILDKQFYKNGEEVIKQ